MGGARKDFQTWGLFLLIPRSSFFHRELTLTPLPHFKASGTFYLAAVTVSAALSAVRVPHAGS